jgi:SAM-dependent methyltransferase
LKERFGVNGNKGAADSGSIPRTSSVNYEHLLSIINTEWRKKHAGSTLRVLDAGCGNGSLIAYIFEHLPGLNPDLDIEVYGFDVSDHVQAKDYFAKTIDLLSSRFPGTDWRKRVSLTTAKERWPFSDEYFDVIISNQVVEHVDDHDLFFSEIYRTLRYGGFSAHIFPLDHCVYEKHCLLPWVHRIRNYDLMRSYIKSLNYLGLGSFRKLSQRYGTIDNLSGRQADFLHYFTNYMSYRDVLEMAKKHKMRVQFKYTLEYYTRKLSIIMGQKPKDYQYRYRISSVADWLAVFFLRYIASVTLFLEKKESFISDM